MGLCSVIPAKSCCLWGLRLAQRRNGNHDDQLDWYLLQENTFCQGLNRLIKDLNHCYRDHPALWHLDYDSRGFNWLITDDWQQSVFAFTRTDGESSLIIICNLTPVVRHHYRVGMPEAGNWKEVFNSDARIYGGSGIENPGDLTTDNHPMHHFPPVAGADTSTTGNHLCDKQP